MSDDGGGPFTSVLRDKIRAAGRVFGEAERAYRSARHTSHLPTDDEGRVRIVCRRYAEQRAVHLDDEGRPECFDAEHPACQGCAEDVQEGVVETW